MALGAATTLCFEPALRVRRLARAEEGDDAALALAASYRGERVISIGFGELESVRQGPATHLVREACWLLKPWGREARIELRSLRRPVRRTLLEWLASADDVTVVATGRRKLVLLPAPDDRERLESSLSTTRRKMLRLGERDGEHCVWCSTPLSYRSLHATLDHVRCRSHGGADGLDNLVLSCAACNHGRANAPASTWLEQCLADGRDVDTEAVLRAIARSHAHRGRALHRAA
ncbi:MAG TPA: HNH endonuclease signature motif containing protein [Gaiellaceae bacterium]|nr:HNH endonuclease signature motif containing protein [Gaiellaceae bacterium]